MQVFTLASDPVRLTSVLVVGSQRALLVDTGAGPDQATRLLAAVRQITDLPLVVANTHDHWDHFFGNPTFAEAGVTGFYGSPAFVRDSPGSAWLQHAEASEHAFDLPGPEELAMPVDPLEDGDVLELGDGEVVEALVATGHTDTDLVLRSGPLLLVGDLVEEGPRWDSTPPRSRGSAPSSDCWRSPASPTSCPATGGRSTSISCGPSARTSPPSRPRRTRTIRTTVRTCPRAPPRPSSPRRAPRRWARTCWACG